MFEFLTDTGSEIDNYLRESLNIGLLRTGVTLKTREIFSDANWDNVNAFEFFKDLEEGVVSIYQPAMNYWKDIIEEIFKKGKDVLFLGMSPRFTGGIKNLNIIKMLLSPIYPDRKLVILDSGLVAGGEKCLVLAVAEYLKDKREEDVEKIASEIKIKFLGRGITYWILDSLKFYMRANRGLDSFKDLNIPKGYPIIKSENGSFFLKGLFNSKEDALEALMGDIKSSPAEALEFTYSPDWDLREIREIVSLLESNLNIIINHNITYQSPSVTAVTGPYSYSIGVLRSEAY